MKVQVKDISSPTQYGMAELMTNGSFEVTVWAITQYPSIAQVVAFLKEKEEYNA